MADKPLDERAIFKVARQIASTEARTEYLAHVCGDDEALFGRMVALLRVHDNEPEFLESMPAALLGRAMPAVAPTIDTPPLEKLGTYIDRYKLVHEIGQGGMGVVYMAVQKEPVRRKVALKIIKPGMDTREVVARFEAERQALALMDHPGIAHVLDGGSTPSGRPYFVMELVNGTPITEYCDECRFTTHQRLELFIRVCQAVQHAHLKGVIHRDIKPSNILVTTDGTLAIPKVIDFGIAKAIHQPLTDGSVYTNIQQMVGTPLYMSPEQAQRAAQDVDTRTDVYSLGVLLYELLTGTTPFDKERLKNSGLDEVKRIIREEEPPRPSTRLSTLGAALDTVVEKHHTDRRTLTNELTGELDWIVMKALEKDRTRRYETANDFARDVQRYLDHLPVEACPPSAMYKLRKFARRNRVALGFTAAITVAFVLVCMALVVAYRNKSETWQARMDLQAAESARLHAEQARENARLDALVQEGLRRGGGLYPDFAGAVENLTEVLARRPDDAAAHLYRGSIYYRWGRPEEARQDLEQSLELSPGNNLAAHQLLAIVAQQLGKTEAAAQHLALAQEANPDTVEALTTQAIALNDRRGLELLTQAIEKQPFDPVLYRHRGQLAFNIAFQQGGTKEIVQLAVSDQEKALKAFPGDRSILRNLGLLLIFQRGQIPEVDCSTRCKELLNAWLATSPNDEDALMILVLYHGFLRGDFAKAIRVGLDALKLHPQNAEMLRQVAECYLVVGRFDEAERLFTRTLELTQDTNLSACAYMRRGVCRIHRGNLEAARADLEKAQQTLPRSDWWGYHWGFLISGYDELGDVETANTLADEWAAQCPKLPDPHHLLADRYTKQQRWDEALREASAAVDLDPQGIIRYAARADIYEKRGQDEQALTDYSKCVELDPRDVSYRRRRAAVLSRLGRDEEANADLEMAVELVTQAIKQGAEDPGTLLSLERLAYGYWLVGKFDRSIPLFEEELGIQKKVLGENHPDTILTMANLGINYLYAGQSAKALPLQEEALSKCRENLPSDHPATLLSIRNLAGAYLGAGRYDEAQRLFEELVRLNTDKFGADHRQTLASMVTLGSVYRQQGQFEKAEPVLQAAFDGLAKLRAATPTPDNNELCRKACEEFIQLYEKSNQPDKAATWKEKLDALTAESRQTEGAKQ